MDRKEISEKLNAYKEEFDELMTLFDTPKDGLSKQETLEYISQKYSDIKSRISEHLKELEKAERSNKLNKDGSAFLVPAIRESRFALSCTKRLQKRAGTKLLYL